MFSRRKGRCCITATRRSSNAPLNPPVVSFAASSNNSPVSPATYPRIPPRKRNCSCVHQVHLFGSESLHRINPRCTTSRQVSCKERHSDQNCCRNRESRRIVSREAKQHPGK